MHDDLVKRLHKRIALTTAGSPLQDDLKEAADAIEELADTNVGKWIPVAERLPKTPGEYMVAYHPCYWDRVHDEIKVGLDSFRGKTSWAKKKYQRVTHWMPLPEPPEEE